MRDRAIKYNKGDSNRSNRINRELKELIELTELKGLILPKLTVTELVKR